MWPLLLGKSLSEVSVVEKSEHEYVLNISKVNYTIWIDCACF